MKAASESGMEAVAITDHGNMSAHVSFEAASKEYGVKPIYGCEFYVVDSCAEKIRKKNHLTVLAKNEQGYQNLLSLLHYSFRDGFYYKQSVDWDVLHAHKEGLIVLSGCYFSKLGNAFQRGEMDEQALEYEVRRQASLFDDYFVEIQPLAFPGIERLSRHLVSIARSLELPLVATNDVHYIRKSFSTMNAILASIRNRKMLSEIDQTDELWMRGEEDMREAFKRWKWFDAWESIGNTQKIVDMCDHYNLPKAKSLTLKTDDPFQALLKMTKQGLENRVTEQGFIENQEVLDRIKTELTVIKDKGFSDYFILVAEIVNWAKDKGILIGPARGSSAGSLVCYLLKITEVDPLRHGLLFERFLAPHRMDPPDIDVDIEDTRRDEVKDYLSERFGEDKVADVCSFTSYKGKNIIDDLKRITDMPYGVAQNLKSGVDIEGTYTAAYMLDENKGIRENFPILRYGVIMEGQYRQMSSHPAGVVISNRPLKELCPVHEKDGRALIGVDFKSLEAIGLMKIDLLGLRALSIIKRAIEYIERSTGEKIDLYKIKLDEEVVYEAFRKMDVLGIFQFEGRSLMQVAKETKPQVFEDLVAITALARPGPLHSGTTKSYIKSRRGEGEPNEVLIDILPETYGFIVYQEQVMKVVQVIGGMSTAEAADIRKVMAKSKGESEMAKFGQKFMNGAMSNGLTIEQAEALWSEIETHGKYSFNLSHSVSYSILGYWMMHFKVHYPLEFYLAAVERAGDDKIDAILKEMKVKGYKVKKPKINLSVAGWTMEGDGIRAGYQSLKGVGPKAAECIETNQPYENMADFVARVQKRSVNSRVIKVLEEAGAFSEFEDVRNDEQLTLTGG